MLLKYALFAAEMLFFVATMLDYICRYSRGFPTGLENPTGLGAGKKLAPRMVTGTGTGLRFSRGDGFGQAKPGGFRSRCHLEWVPLVSDILIN